VAWVVCRAVRGNQAVVRGNQGNQVAVASCRWDQWDQWDRHPDRAQADRVARVSPALIVGRQQANPLRVADRAASDVFERVS